GEFYIVRFRAHQRFIVRPDTGRHRGAAFVGLGDAEIDFGFHLRFSFLSMSAIRSFNRLRSLANSLRNRFSSVRRLMTQRTASKPCFLIAASTSDLALRYFDLSDRFMWCLIISLQELRVLGDAGAELGIVGLPPTIGTAGRKAGDANNCERDQGRSGDADEPAHDAPSVEAMRS